MPKHEQCPKCDGLYHKPGKHKTYAEVVASREAMDVYRRKDALRRIGHLLETFPSTAWSLEQSRTVLTALEDTLVPSRQAAR